MTNDQFMFLFLGVTCLAAVCICFVWPWVDPYLIRRDAYTRLLDRMEEEWEREEDDTDGPIIRNGMGW